MNNEFRAGYNRPRPGTESAASGRRLGEETGHPQREWRKLSRTSTSAYGLSGTSAEFQQIGRRLHDSGQLHQDPGPAHHQVGIRTDCGRGTTPFRQRSPAAAIISAAPTRRSRRTPARHLPHSCSATVTSATFTQDFASWLPRWWSHQWYIQDDWKPLPKLSLNLGLRYSYETPFQTKYGQDSQFDPTAKDPVTGMTGAIVHQPGPLARPDRNNFAPRLGLAWNFRSKWVFRRSFGVDSPGHLRGNPEHHVRRVPGHGDDCRHQRGIRGTMFRSPRGRRRFTYAVRTDGSVPFIGTNYSTRPASRWDPNMRMPYVVNCPAAYSGSSSELAVGNHLPGAVRGWTDQQLGHECDSARISPATRRRSTRFSRRRRITSPTPQFGSINYYSNFGHNTHHSGTLRVEKRHSCGFDVECLLHWSKTLDGDRCRRRRDTASLIYNRSLEKARAITTSAPFRRAS